MTLEEMYNNEIKQLENARDKLTSKIREYENKLDEPLIKKLEEEFIGKWIWHEADEEYRKLKGVIDENGLKTIHYVSVKFSDEDEYYIDIINNATETVYTHRLKYWLNCKIVTDKTMKTKFNKLVNKMKELF